MRLGSPPAPGEGGSRFNPLFIGSKDATAHAWEYHPASHRFNPLFIGSKDATVAGPTGACGVRMFQSPFHRVKGCDGETVAGESFDTNMFQSPFHRVKGCDGIHATGDGLHRGQFQSPFHRVKGCDTVALPRGDVRMKGFNPLFIGSKDATNRDNLQ